MDRMSAEASVLPVSSNTRKDSAKPLAMLPAAPSTVATVSSVKFFVQSVGFMCFHLTENSIAHP